MRTDGIRERIYICTFAEGCNAAAREYGYGLELNQLCISRNLDEDRFQKTLERARLDMEMAGTDNFIVHGPFTELSPCCMDPLALELTKSRFRQTAEFCRELGAERLVLHTGYFPPMYHKEWLKRVSPSFWREYAQEVMPPGLTLCIENVFEDEPLVLKEMIEEIGHPRVRACLDVGHINAMTDGEWPAERWIEEMGHLTLHFHLHNNRGGKVDLHDDFDKGTMDPGSVMDAIERFCPEDTTLTIESRQAAPSAEWLARRYGIEGSGR